MVGSEGFVCSGILNAVAPSWLPSNSVISAFESTDLDLLCFAKSLDIFVK